jgi:signal transduction histidine kinase
MTHSSGIFPKLIKDTRFRVVLFSLLSCGILAVSLTFFALSIGKPYMGVMLSADVKGWVVKMVDTNSVAGQAGIKVGDRPVEINGQPAEVFLEKYQEVGTVFGQSIKDLTVLNGRGQLKVATLEGNSPSQESKIAQASWLIASLTFWIIGFYVLFKRPRNMAALLLCLCGLMFGLTLSANMAGERATPVAIPIAIIATVIGPWLLTHFFLILPEERASLRDNPLVYLVYLPAAVTIILLPLIGYADGQPLPGFRAFRLFEYGAGFLAAASVAIFNYLGSVSRKTRQQMKIVLISCLAALVPILFLNIIPQVIWRQPVVPPGFSFLFIIFIPLGMGYAIVTQKLMDIDVFIRRGVIYGLISLVMGAFLSVAIFLTLAFRESWGIPELIVLALLLGSIATALFGPVKKNVEILADRLFYKDRYDYRQIINGLSASLNSVKDVAETSRLIVGTAVHTLNLAGGCVFLNTQSSFEVGAAQGTFSDIERQKLLTTLISQRNPMIEFPNPASAVYVDVAFLIPLITKEKQVGVLCLSSKVSRQDFSPDDLFLLQGIASVAAIALRSAMLIRDVSIRDTFVSVASHELRTPLTAIMGYSELLMHRNPPEDKRKQWLKNIHDNSRRMSTMVDDLLNVSRIQSGKIRMNLTGVSLADVLEGILALIKESTGKHEFITDIESNLPDMLVDRDKFSQVIVNLLSNAIKYSPNGGRITLSAHRDPQRSFIVVSVADEGIGIGPEDKASLFTTFHRIQRPETQDIRGSGLGLYIAKEWTEAMGGEIWLDSELNKGSTFFVAVPMQKSIRQAERDSLTATT